MYTVLPNKDDEKYIDLVSPSGEILTSNWKGTAGSGTKELSKMADILNAEIAPLRQRIAELENAVEKALAALPDADAAAAYLREVVEPKAPKATTLAEQILANLREYQGGAFVKGYRLWYTASEIAKALDIDVSTAVQSLHELANKGLVQERRLSKKGGNHYTLPY